VDDAYQRCLAMGANVHHRPELDRDIEDYYALFVFDPDGIRVEIACAPSVDRFEPESRSPNRADHERRSRGRTDPPRAV
jgi:hypothetical protein